MDLNKIKDPSFLKTLDIKECESLAEDIRSFLIENVSKTGGHLSSNLGAVELTIALHKVFESPKDKLIFDVGHQSYVHKILTGRAQQFSTLRQYKGLSGYIKRNESEHDIFEAGHSSTSIAASAGIEFSKKYTKNNYRVIPIIGDGALTGGMAFEALNFLGEDRSRNPIIVLNDNEMSITENIGVLARILNSVRGKTSYRKFKGKLSRLIPRFLRRFSGKVERGIKGFVSDNTLFDDFGFSYYGPINGHDIKELLKYFNIAKRSSKPCVIHVLTEKGKGYKYSEKDTLGLWHGVGPFVIESGEQLAHAPEHQHTWSEIIAHYMEDYASKNEKFCVVVPAMVAGSGFLSFKEKFPKRLYDVGIAEQTAVTMSAGLAISGVQVFTPIYSTFVQRAYDQVNHDVARQNLNMVIGIDRAGLVGADGETHQGVFDIPLLRHIPNVTIVHPIDANEAYELLNYGFKEHIGPFVIRYPRGRIEFNYATPITSAIASLDWKILQTGTNAVFVSYGSILQPVIKQLEKEEISVEVVNARTIKPLDFEMIEYMIKKDIPIIVYEESALLGGFGSSILEYCNAKKLPTHNITLMGIKDAFVQHGSHSELLKEQRLDVLSVIETIKSTL